MPDGKPPTPKALSWGGWGELLGSSGTPPPPSSILPAQVEAEDWAGEEASLQQALQSRGAPTLCQGWVGQAHDAIKLELEEIGTWLVLTKAKLLVGDLSALDLEGTQGMGDDKWNFTHLPIPSPTKTLEAPLFIPPSPQPLAFFFFFLIF